MTNKNDRQEEEQRESIGSIRSRWRLFFSICFVAQALPGMAFIIWLELVHATTDSPDDTIKAIIWGIAVVGGASVATTGVFTEAFELMLGTRDIINDWLQRRREESETKLLEQGREEGREEGIAETLAWVERRDTARENDEPFDEPPPHSDLSE